jgi:hypothetical protein
VPSRESAGETGRETDRGRERDRDRERGRCREREREELEAMDREGGQ